MYLFTVCILHLPDLGTTALTGSHEQYAQLNAKKEHSCRTALFQSSVIAARLHEQHYQQDLICLESTTLDHAQLCSPSAIGEDCFLSHNSVAGCGRNVPLP